MPKMPDPGEYHGQTGGVGGFDDFPIPHRSAGLNNRGSAGLGGREQAIGEGEKGIGSNNRTFG